MGRGRSQGENDIKNFSQELANFGDCRLLISPDRRSDRSRCGGVDPTEKQVLQLLSGELRRGGNHPTFA